MPPSRKAARHPVEDALELLGRGERVLPVAEREGLLEPLESAVGLDPLLLGDAGIGPGNRRAIVDRASLRRGQVVVSRNRQETGFQLQRGRHAVECLDPGGGQLLAVGVEVDEARGHDHSGRIEPLGAIEPRLRDGRDAAVPDPHVSNRVEACLRVHHPPAFEHEIVGAGFVRTGLHLLCAHGGRQRDRAGRAKGEKRSPVEFKICHGILHAWGCISATGRAAYAARGGQVPVWSGRAADAGTCALARRV
jgi:hypothetical protein